MDRLTEQSIREAEACAPPGYRAIIVDKHEYGLIVSGLRRMRLKLAEEMRRSRAGGFVPAEGHKCVPSMRAETLAKLFARLGIAPRGE